MEVVRDKADNCIIVCSIENVDPMGVHTGDSITVAPALTLTDKEYQIMRDASIAVLREIGVETGGSNVQFAVNPDDGRLVVIEMNPRVSRSSALASKATGFPIAKVAAKLAVGYTLDELDNDITGGATPASFEPTIDYVVTKIPRFAFEKFPGAEPLLTTSMKSVGEVMAIGRTFAEMPAEGAARARDRPRRPRRDRSSPASARATTRTPSAPRSATPTPDRLLACAQALRLGMTVEEIHAVCRIDPWFLRQLQAIVESEAQVRDARPAGDRRAAAAAEGAGLLRRPAGRARRRRRRPTWRRCAPGSTSIRSTSASTPAPPSSPRPPPISTRPTRCPSPAPRRTRPSPATRKKVIILGGGPNRIGQGIEFDYCCCHACFALADAGYEIDHGQLQPGDRVDRLRHLRPALFRAADGRGRARDRARRAVEGHARRRHRPVRRADAAEARQRPAGGQRADPRHLARHDRPRRGPRPLPEAAHQARPASSPRTASPTRSSRRGWSPPTSACRWWSAPPTCSAAAPCRSSASEEQLANYLLGTLPELVPSDVKARYPNDKTGQINTVLGKNPLLFDRYLSDAIEIDVDALSDGNDVFIAGIMEHIEEAGIHSGDSACSLPPHSLSPEIIAELERADPPAGAGARGGRPDERPVRDQGRRPLRARGQSARLAHGALRRQDRSACRSPRSPPG